MHAPSMYGLFTRTNTSSVEQASRTVHPMGHRDPLPARPSTVLLARATVPTDPLLLLDDPPVHEASTVLLARATVPTVQARGEERRRRAWSAPSADTVRFSGRDDRIRAMSSPRAADDSSRDWRRGCGPSCTSHQQERHAQAQWRLARPSPPSALVNPSAAHEPRRSGERIGGIACWSYETYWRAFSDAQRPARCPPLSAPMCRLARSESRHGQWVTFWSSVSVLTSSVQAPRPAIHAHSSGDIW